MSLPPPVHVLAVYSPDPGAADFFKRTLDSAGFAAFVAPSDIASLDAFVLAIHPAAIVFDVAATSEAQ